MTLPVPYVRSLALLAVRKDSLFCILGKAFQFGEPLVKSDVRSSSWHPLSPSCCAPVEQMPVVSLCVCVVVVEEDRVGSHWFVSTLCHAGRFPRSPTKGVQGQMHVCFDTENLWNKHDNGKDRVRSHSRLRAGSGAVLCDLVNCIQPGTIAKARG